MVLISEISPKPSIISAHKQFNYVKFQNETHGSINAMDALQLASSTITEPQTEELLIDISPITDTKTESSKYASTRKPLESPAVSIIDLPIGEGKLHYCIHTTYQVIIL